MGRGLLSHRYKSTQRGRLTSICTQIQAEHTQQMSAWRKHLHERSASRDFDARLSCAIRLSCSPSIPTSSMPDKNVSLCTRGPILCLKSHLHLFFFFFFLVPALSFPSSVLSVSPAPPRLLQLQRGPQTPSLSSSSSPSRPCTRPDHTCHLHRTQPRDLTPPRLSSIPHLALQSLSSPHPGTLSLRNGRCGGSGQSGTQSGLFCEDVCVLSRARGESARVRCV